jgi:hypothetical protein
VARATGKAPQAKLPAIWGRSGGQCPPYDGRPLAEEPAGSARHTIVP